MIEYPTSRLYFLGIHSTLYIKEIQLKSGILPVALQHFVALFKHGHGVLTIRHTTPYHTTPHHTTPHHTTLYHTIPHHTALCRAVLSYPILSYPILHYTILYAMP